MTRSEIRKKAREVALASLRIESSDGIAYGGRVSVYAIERFGIEMWNACAMEIEEYLLHEVGRENEKMRLMRLGGDHDFFGDDRQRNLLLSVVRKVNTMRISTQESEQEKV